nr:histone deacetylase 9 isoform X1 [Ipomoea batatas]
MLLVCRCRRCLLTSIFPILMKTPKILMSVWISIHKTNKSSEMMNIMKVTMTMITPWMMHEELLPPWGKRISVFRDY